MASTICIGFSENHSPIHERANGGWSSWCCALQHLNSFKSSTTTVQCLTSKINEARNRLCLWYVYSAIITTTVSRVWHSKEVKSESLSTPSKHFSKWKVNQSPPLFISSFKNWSVSISSRRLRFPLSGNAKALLFVFFIDEEGRALIGFLNW